jgi:hypothetical protein
MVEIATVLAAETLLEKMVSLAYRFYGWMYPAIDYTIDNNSISTEEEKEMVIVVKRIMEERKK